MAFTASTCLYVSLSQCFVGADVQEGHAGLEGHQGLERFAVDVGRREVQPAMAQGHIGIGQVPSAGRPEMPAIHRLEGVDALFAPQGMRILGAWTARKWPNEAAKLRNSPRFCLKTVKKTIKSP